MIPYGSEAVVIPLFSREQTGALLVMVTGAALMAGLGRIVVPSTMWLSTNVAIVGLAGAIAVVLSPIRSSRAISDNQGV